MISVQNVTKTSEPTHNPTRSPGSRPARDDTRPVVQGVTMAVDEGSIHGVLGPAGAGKSRLLQTLGLTERPDTGVVHVDSLDPAGPAQGLHRERIRMVGFVDPTAVLHPERTAAGNIAAPLERTGIDGPARKQRVVELVDLIGLNGGATHRPGELSEGQRRRVALARALVMRPSVLIVDELTRDLPSDAAGAVLAALERARAELGVTVVVATTDAGIVRRICDQVSVLTAGRIVETGTVLELLSDQDSYTARSLLPPIDRPSSEDGGGVHDRLVDVVLVGLASVGSLLPEAGVRFDAELRTLGGGTTRVGETPVGRFRLGVSGSGADAALDWIAERGGYVTEVEPTAASDGSGVSAIIEQDARRLTGPVTDSPTGSLTGSVSGSGL